MLLLHSVSQEEEGVNGLVPGSTDEQLQPEVGTTAQLLPANVSQRLLLLLLSPPERAGQSADQFAEQEAELGWQTKGATQTGPCLDRTQFDDEGRPACLAHLLGVLLPHLQRPNPGTGHDSLRPLLCVLWQAEILSIGWSSSPNRFTGHQYHSGAEPGLLCDLLPGRLGLVHLVGHDPVENCT